MVDKVHKYPTTTSKEIADVIADVQKWANSVWSAEHHFTEHESVNVALYVLADNLAEVFSEYRHFDRERFIEACGLVKGKRP